MGIKRIIRYGPDLEKIGQLERDRADLLACLRAMLDCYISLVNSGDCGNWDVESEEEVKRARALLARLEAAK